MSEITTSREEYITGLKNQIERWNAEIARCEAKAKSADGKRLEPQIQSLRAQRDMALTKLRLLR